MAAVPAIGLVPGPGEGWWEVGRNFAIVLPGVTVVAMGFQVLSGADGSLGTFSRGLPWAIILSVSNAFVEETLTRFGMVAALHDPFGPRVAIWASALLFGGVHWSGLPGGPAGVALAGFLGWLLAKSLVETGGMGWAYVLHFLVDVVIFACVLAVQP
ncbi:MAG: CPBP family intramembrane metalloprotease [Myxococcales bacterium]|nr:CPBP family intramembrane metalloprotease [Myxococcales bacterium]